MEQRNGTENIDLKILFAFFIFMGLRLMRLWFEFLASLER